MALKATRVNPDRLDRSQIKFFIILIPLAIFMALPIVFIFCHALKPVDELFAFPPSLFVKRPTLDNFRNLFITSQSSGIPASRFFINSIFVTAVVMLGSVFVSSLAGFALSKLTFKSKKLVFEINNLALMFVPVAVMIPRYLTINAIGITNTMFAHIVPYLIMPIGVFLIKQFIDQVPDALIEAAVIDGASYFMVYRKIVIPLIRPALATASILAFQFVWNNIESSALFVSREGIRTISFYMNTLATTSLGNSGNVVAGQGIAAAASLIMFLPNLILFIILQKNVMNTMAHSGIK